MLLFQLLIAIFIGSLFQVIHSLYRFLSKFVNIHNLPPIPVP